MANRKEKNKGIEGFNLKEYKPVNGRLLITLNSDSSLLSGSKQAVRKLKYNYEELKQLKSNNLNWK